MDFGFGSFYSGSIITSINAFGSFFDTTRQTALINTPTPMVCNNIDFINNMNYDKITGEMEVLYNGYYNIQFSCQLNRLAGGSPQHIDIWFALNGNAIPNSDTRINLNNNNVYQVASWNYFIAMNSGDKAQIFYAVTDANIVLEYQPESLIIPHPAIPSVIKTMNKIGDL